LKEEEFEIFKTTKKDGWTRKKWHEKKRFKVEMAWGESFEERQKSMTNVFDLRVNEMRALNKNWMQFLKGKISEIGNCINGEKVEKTRVEFWAKKSARNLRRKNIAKKLLESPKIGSIFQKIWPTNQRKNSPEKLAHKIDAKMQKRKKFPVNFSYKKFSIQIFSPKKSRIKKPPLKITPKINQIKTTEHQFTEFKKNKTSISPTKQHGFQSSIG
jgi:hypothetical protein